MDAFHERLAVRAATIDELLSDSFEPWAGANDQPDLTARRLAAWSRSCAANDPALFARRLERDNWSIAQVQARLNGVRRRESAPLPAWIEDAIWIEAALHDHRQEFGFGTEAGTEIAAEPYPFEHLFASLVAQAERRLWADLEARVSANLTATGRASLRQALFRALSGLCTAALYERFAKARSAGAATAGAAQPHDRGTAGYNRFAAAMKAGGFRSLFEDKPVLLRLIVCVTRQWIDTSREFVLRLDADLPAIRRDILEPSGTAAARVAAVAGDLSDPHNDGHSVLIATFEDGARVAYKPKDLRLDVAWHALIARLNRADPPFELMAPRAIARNGYGWAEFIAHTGCTDAAACARFFRRAGAWLALLHAFAATDMHQENMIAAGEHPVPIDLETILQPSPEEHKANDPEGAAFDAAMDIVGNSVMTVGLLPAYGRSVDNQVFAMGGMTADWNLRTVVKWHEINSDAMRPAKAKEHSTVTPNLPHVDGRYARFGDHIEDFIAGFADYAAFLLRHSRSAAPAALFAGFAGLPVRKIVRPTRFYHMLVQRLRDHRTMDDGAVWSAQADFVARLSQWDDDPDPLWPLHRAERAALLSLSVPHFVSPSDGATIADARGSSIPTTAVPGLDRAVARLQHLDEQEIAWQVEVIREGTRPAAIPTATASPVVAPRPPTTGEPDPPTPEYFRAEADRIAADLTRYAVRRGPSAAWIGLDWLGDAEVFQLVCLGPDLYNGATGIALFLAAHAAATGNDASGELALAGLAHLRKNLKSRNAARLARSLGIGGATGLGSVVYALAVAAKCLGDSELLADAARAAQLFTDALIDADKQLDVMGGAAGAILGLLRLYRDSGSDAVLGRAVKCGEHLLGENRVGSPGRRTWIGQGFGAHGLNGMSHGAAGFAYALAALAAASGRDDFEQAAAECLAFENASYDAKRHNWPDLRGAEPHWPCQWCHGATGIGLARLATARHGAGSIAAVAADIDHALEGVAHGTPMPVDTLCCGTLGSIEFFCEAATGLQRDELRDRARSRLATVVAKATATGDYRWNSGKRQFNLGLFRGLAGVGYTLLRQSGAALPNVLIWE